MCVVGLAQHPLHAPDPLVPPRHPGNSRKGETTGRLSAHKAQHNIIKMDNQYMKSGGNEEKDILHLQMVVGEAPTDRGGGRQRVREPPERRSGSTSSAATGVDKVKKATDKRSLTRGSSEPVECCANWELSQDLEAEATKPMEDMDDELINGDAGLPARPAANATASNPQRDDIWAHMGGMLDVQIGVFGSEVAGVMENLDARLSDKISA